MIRRRSFFFVGFRFLPFFFISDERCERPLERRRLLDLRDLDLPRRAPPGQPPLPPAALPKAAAPHDLPRGPAGVPLAKRLGERELRGDLLAASARAVGADADGEGRRRGSDSSLSFPVDGRGRERKGGGGRKGRQRDGAREGVHDGQRRGVGVERGRRRRRRRRRRSRARRGQRSQRSHLLPPLLPLAEARQRHCECRDIEHLVLSSDLFVVL